MSWEAYVDHLKNYKATYGAIYGGADGAKYASSPELPVLDPNQVKTIFNAIKSSDQSYMGTKEMIGNLAYTKLSISEFNGYKIKLKENGAYSFDTSKTLLIVAFTKEGVNQGDGATAANKTADYLSSVGY